MVSAFSDLFIAVFDVPSYKTAKLARVHCIIIHCRNTDSRKYAKTKTKTKNTYN